MGTIYPELSINLGTFETDYPMRIKALIYQFSILPLQVCTTIHRQECAPVTKQHCTVADEPVCDTVYEVSNIEEDTICCGQVLNYRMCVPRYQSRFARQVTKFKMRKIS